VTEALTDREAERAVLGSVLVSPEVLSSVEGVLRPEHFSDHRNRAVFAAMLTLSESGHAVDHLTIRDELQSTGSLVEAGGLAYIGTLSDGMPRVNNATGWARIVRDKAKRRAAVTLGERLTAMAQGSELETDELLDRHMSSVSRLMEASDLSVRKMDEVLPQAMKDLDEFATSPSGLTGVPTGLPDLDKLTGGLKKGVLFILGARPARGKSTFCAQVATYAAAKGFRVLVFCMEMPAEDVAQRMLLSEAEVDRWDLRIGKSDTAWGKVGAAFSKLEPLPIWFDGRESPTMAQVRGAAKQQAARHGIDLVIVDYLQRCTVDPKLDRWLAVGELARGLKSLARNLNVPVLAACQLNAEAEEKRPTLANLGQSQAIISAEADIVGFLHPEHLDKWKEQDYPVINLLVDKHRAGATGSIPLSFEKATLRLLNLSRQPGER
jgi:replicative DNA helicase